MIEVIKKYPIIFAETSLGDNYTIKMKDIADFIKLESDRTGHCADIFFYIPSISIDEPVLTTYGCFLNKVNPTLREEIIERLTLLQTGRELPKKVKIFNNEVFCNMTAIEMGIINNKVENFEEFYGKYVNI